MIHSQDDLPPYLQPWFQEIAIEAEMGGAGVIAHRVRFNDGEGSSGRMEFVSFPNRARLRLGRDLCAAHIGGPVVLGGDKRFVTEKLVERLPRKLSLHFILPNFTDVRPFIEHGFSHRREENMRIVAKDEGEWWRSLKKKYRAKMRQGDRDLDFRVMDADSFVLFYQDNLAEQRLRPTLMFDAVRRLLLEGERRGQARVLAAFERSTGKAVAANASIWSKEGYYNWLTTYVREARTQSSVGWFRQAAGFKAKPTHTVRRAHQSAVRALMLHGVRHALSMGLEYDFDGARNENVKSVYQEFNGTQFDKHVVYRYTFAMKVWVSIRDVFNSLSRRFR